MSEFVPFGPTRSAANRGSDFRLKVLPQPQNVQRFQPATPPTAAAACGHGPSGAAPTGHPKVTLQRDGDRVTRIQVICACGQQIELDCVY
ncbi:MAG: hypothetical protein HZA90_15750 [Verrucomicrobia bacterium]|nr:hypothetical protein [Verrucomicrobiota bacterium]